MKRLLPLLCCFPLCATDLSPYFPPTWQPVVRANYLYQYENNIETPLGSFHLNNPINNAGFGLNLTVWPDWDGEIELLLSSNPATDVNFSYQATRLTGRYLVFDEVNGAPLSLATGVTFFAVRSSFLTATSCWFHGNFNAEMHMTMGKEYLCNDEWWMRLWGYAGFGLANKGQPWWHSIAELELKMGDYAVVPMMELVFGMGNNDINPIEPFSGYGGINHQFVNIGLSLRRITFCAGEFEINGWYNVHAHNYPEDYFGVGATWYYPISLKI